jgi:hypothetical protein
MPRATPSRFIIDPPRAENGRTAWAPLAILLLGVSIALALAFLPRSHPISIEGLWQGRDRTGRLITFQFYPDGTGYEVIERTRALLHYTFSPGYPNRIAVRFDSANSSAIRHGLVQPDSRTHILLQLGAPGADGPTQLDDRAIELSRPPTR